MRRLLVAAIAAAVTVGLAPAAQAAAPVMSWVTTPGSLVTSTGPVVFDWDATGATVTWYYLYRKNAYGDFQTYRGAYPWPTDVTFDTLPDGEYKLDAGASDGAGGFSSLSYPFEVDAVAEAETAVPQITADGPVAFTVSSTPSAAGNALDSYDVRTIVWTWMSPGSGSAYEYPEAWQATTSSSFTLPGPPRGTFVCFSARAREVGGALGPWSEPNCSSTALDDRQFTRLADAEGSTTNDRWIRDTGDQYTFRRAIRTKVRGHVAVTDRIVPWWKQPVLVATTCPTCGRVSVSLTAPDFGAELGTYSLVSEVRRNGVAIPLAELAEGGVDFGRLRVAVVSRDKRVQLDGFAVLPPPDFR